MLANILKINFHIFFFIFSLCVVIAQTSQPSGIQEKEIQEKSNYQFGAKLFYQFSRPLDIEREPGVINKYNYNGLGVSKNHGAYVGLRYSNYNLIENDMGLALSAALGASVGDFTTNYFLIDTASPEIGRQRFIVNSFVNTILLDATVNYSFPTFRIGGGGWLDLRVKANTTQTLEYEDTNVPKRLIAYGNALTTPPIRFGLAFSGNYGFNIFPSLRLELEPTLRVDLSALSKVNISRIWIAGLGLNVSSAIIERTIKEEKKEEKKNENLAVINDTVIPIKPINKPSGAVTFKLNNVPTSVAEIQTIQTNNKAYYPLKTKFFFNEISNSNYLSANERDSFKINSLSKKKVAEVEKNQINFFAYRLQKDASAQVTLVNNYTSEPQMAIANKVKDYWVNVWGINQEKILIENKKTKSENDFLEIGTNIQSLLAPIVVEWIENSYSLPKITITKKIDSQSPIISAVTTLFIGENLIGRYYGSDEIKPQGYDALILLDKNNEPPKIVAQLQLKDSLGASAGVSDTLTLKMGSGQSIEQKNYFTFYFPVDLAENSVATREAFVNKIVSSLGEGSVVAISAKCSDKAIFTQSLSLAQSIRNSGGGNISFLTDELLEDFIKVELQREK